MGLATRMRELPVHDAIGTVLCHDITQIIPGQSKKALFRKGHVIRPEDVDPLLTVGKEHIYVFDLAEGLVHEEEAATRAARAVAGPGIILGPPGEGKVTLSAAITGLLTVDARRLMDFNGQDELVLSTLHTNQMVHKGQNVAGVHITPLVMEEAALLREEGFAEHGPLIQVRPLRRASVGVVTTGSEVYGGRVKDAFGPVLTEKFARLGSSVARQMLVSDDLELTARAIMAEAELGAAFSVVSGGRSVDRGVRSPAGIRAAGAEIISYGAPVLPGAMFLLAYLGDIPVLGLPGCVMYFKHSVFDLVVPRLLAGDRLSRPDIAALGHGGYCSACAECRFPACAFGKGA